jgi:cytochrome c oxidase subunit 1
MSAEGHDHAIDHEHEHHHKDTFITKYIFSIDHKMIAKQYLITGIIMGLLVLVCLCYLECNWHGQKNL